jgi:membrane protein DedA with SNARE-associated domain
MLPDLISQFGYPAVLFGTFLEGETILVLGGLAAHRGYLDLRLVILAAFIGSTAGDQLFYFLGRTRHEALLAKRPGWQARINKVEALIENYRLPLLLGFRFVYGLRTITPFTLGMAGITPRIFIPLNILGALIWAVVIGVAGYYFGDLLEVVLGEVKKYEEWLFLSIAVIGALVWLVFFLRRQRLLHR